MDPSLLIIGAGPGGLMAAWSAARHAPPGSILVVDRMPAAGLKLAVTGGGRGNLSHVASEEEFATAFGKQGRFTIPAFRALPPETLRTRLADMGVPTTVDASGRIYPRSQSAAQVRDALLDACTRAGVRFSFSQRVDRIRPPAHPGGTWQVDGFSARSVLLATGGQSAPHLGSDGSGFALARSLGYDLVPPVPALTALPTVEKWPATHSGLSLPEVILTLPDLRGPDASERGELLFTHRGISGPAVLNLSARVARLLQTRKEVIIQLALLPEKPDFRQLRQAAGIRSIHAWLARQLPRTLGGTLMDLAGIPHDHPFSQLTAEQERRLGLHLTALPLTIRGTGSFAESMATSGGISLKQVRPDTLEGRLAPRLYFAGEVLDLHGPTGGWNLQWAFCSGALAGASAAHA